MKAILLILLLSSTLSAQVKYQSGYIKKSGKYVNGHLKTKANKTKVDNLKKRN